MLREVSFRSWLDVDKGNRCRTQGDAVVIAASDITITNIITTIDINCCRWCVQHVCGSNDGWRCTNKLLLLLLLLIWQITLICVCGRQITITRRRLLWECNIRTEFGCWCDWAGRWSLGWGYRSGSSRRDDNFNTLHSAISAKRQLQKNLLKRKRLKGKQ